MAWNEKAAAEAEKLVREFVAATLLKQIDEKMNTILFWTLILVGTGLFVYFLPYKNIKLVQKKLDTIIELLNKKDNNK